MKKIAFLLLALPFVFSCNNSGNNSTQSADSTNNAKTDTSMNNTTMDTTNKMNKSTGTMAVDKSTADFMVKVADVGMTEVRLGRMAQDKAMNQRVKDFGSMMVKDHTAAGDDLKSLASKKNVALPETVSNDHQMKIDALDKKSGKDFDKDYMDEMVKGHVATVDDFEKASKDTKDPDVKSWIDKTLPVLQMHLDSAKAIKRALK